MARLMDSSSWWVSPVELALLLVVAALAFGHRVPSLPTPTWLRDAMRARRGPDAR